MRFDSKKIISFFVFVVVMAIGYEVAYHESTPRKKTTVENIQLSVGTPAYALNLDRGFADLVKRAIPGVVNISTYARPRVQPGMGQMGQNEMFQRFFEEFFGGRLPGPPGQMRPMPPQGGEDEEGAPRGMPRRGGKSVPVALGTGFIIDASEGHILTNNHVIQGAEEVKIQLKEDSELIPAEVIGRDPELDVALLKVKSKTPLIEIPMGDSDAIDVGEYVLAMGNPLGYGHTVSHGILSAKGRRNPEFRMGKYLQTDASINPGNSGGPLINVKGEVVGINNAIDARAQGIGFAIPINLVRGILGQLKSKGSVTRGYLGVSAADLTPELAEQLQIDPRLQGIVVADVARGAPADKAGIKPYDVITSVNDEKLTNAQDLTLKISSVAVGDKAKVEVVRGGKTKTFDVKVAERPTNGVAQARPVRGVEPPAQGAGFEDFGFSVENLGPHNARNYRVPSHQGGVIVAEVEYGSGAANSGLNRGDIILDVAGKEVKTVSDLDRALKGNKGNSIMLRVKRFDSAGNEFVSVVVLTK